MSWEIRQGHVLDLLAAVPAESVHCVVTSPPYWGLRDYKLPPVLWPDGWTGHLGLEPTIDMWVGHLVEVFRAMRRVLRDDGVCWVNCGDSYAASRTYQVPDSKHVDVGNRGGASVPIGLKPLDLIGQPWRLAFALQTDGWYLRSDMIWAKANPMPESVNGWRWERCRIKTETSSRAEPHHAHALAQPGRPQGHRVLGDTFDSQATWATCPGCSKCAPNDGLVLRRGAWRPTRSHEYVFQLAKNPEYFCDAEAVRETATYGNHPRSVFDNVPPPPPGDPPHTGLRHAPGLESGRNLRSVLSLPTQPFVEAHFATFPEALVRPLILAATSECGVCARCGAPWARVIEQQSTGEKQKKADGWATYCGGHGSFHRDGREHGETGLEVMYSRTLGWRPTCCCVCLDTIPATVLDPFAGSGTAGVVAVKLVRQFIGLELSESYCAMARRRIGEVAPLFTAEGVPPKSAVE